MDRKELISQYKNRKQIGGVFAIKNTVLDKWFVDTAKDLAGAKNRFGFFPDSYMKIAGDYKKQKAEGFVFEILEEIEKGEAQTDIEFGEDLELLKSIWNEKLAGQNLY